MYSNLDEEADIVYVTDQTDQALPMDVIFRTGSGTSKKMYKKELSALTQISGRNLDEATLEERARAGHAVLITLLGRVSSKNRPSTATSLRLYRQTFRLENGALTHLAPERLAESSLPTR